MASNAAMELHTSGGTGCERRGVAETDTDNGKAEVMKYRKTALIEATQWWQMGDHPAVKMTEGDITKDVAFITTLEGDHIVTPGDWIATGVHGEHWPIKPDIFAKTYEPVTD